MTIDATKSRAARARPPRPGAVFVLVNVAMLWLSTAIAATALWPIYRSAGVLVVVATGLVLGSLIGVLGAMFRWPSPVVMLATVVGFLAVGVPVAVPSQASLGLLPTPDGLRDLVTGVALGWKQLLTISLPVGEYQALLVPAFVLVLGASVIGSSVALRARRGELAVLAPVVVFIVATAFGPSFPERPIAAPIALLVAVLLWLVWFRWYRRRAAIRMLAAQSGGVRSDSASAGIRTAVAAVVILAVASGAAVAATASVPPTADRTVLRTTIVQPFDPRDYVSPLAGFRGYWRLQQANSVLFEVNGLPEGGRIRLATLDSYDGVVYAVGSDAVSSDSGSFTRVPVDFDQSRVEGEQVTLRVAIADYSGVWLPTIGKFESIRFAGSTADALRDAFYYNDTTGTAAVVGGIGPGDSYTLTAVVPDQPTRSELAGLEPGAATVPAPLDVPDELTARLDEYVTGIETPGERLLAMLDGLAEDGYISHGVGEDEPPSRSGHAADRIAELLTAPRMIGDGEQYAVTAALMARDLGFPARVVLGFVPTDGQGDVEVRGDDVSAWIEVDTAQYGWVAIDPNPPLREIPDELPEDNTQVARPQTIVPPPVLEPEPFDRQSTPESEQDLPPDLNPVLQALLLAARIIGFTFAGLAILIAPFIVVIAAKVRRRRLRRKAPTPMARISGGWQEFEDAVLDHGLSPAASATRSEVASIAGGVQSQVLAAVADRAVFAPEEPGEAQADSVWRAVDELQASLDSGLTRWERLRARISLRSLGGYSVRKLFKH